jgi:D-3-phosphoglycerate dehydrogenase
MGVKLYTIKVFDSISDSGLSKFKSNFKISDENPDAILVRSSKIEISDQSNLKCIGRAGSGVNNIPVKECTERGIVVFNTPGANSNAVKEATICSLFLASRNLVSASSFLDLLSVDNDEELNSIVEKSKEEFKGVEIKGKNLGVIGLGAIGMKVANYASAMRMNVEGFDPFISVKHAWALSRNVKPAFDLNKMVYNSDYVTIHVPLMENTKNYVDASLLSNFKPGSVLINFSRGGVVDEDAVVDSLDNGRLSCYVTDFPSLRLIKHEKVLCFPHIGASTKESEENCATSVVSEVIDYLENGNIVNSVNFPECRMERSTDCRLTVINKNIPNMVSQIASELQSLNISGMTNKSKDDIAYNIVDVDEKGSQPFGPKLINSLIDIEGVLMVRVI